VFPPRIFFSRLPNFYQKKTDLPFNFLARQDDALAHIFEIFLGPAENVIWSFHRLMISDK